MRFHVPFAGCLLFALVPTLSAAALRTAAAEEPAAEEPAVEEPAAVIARTIERTRGLTSHAVMTMRIVRPTWRREITMEAWTRGREDALIRFTEPARDRGNATLKLAERMWTFTPKLNRAMRLPTSLMSQSWTGSDFSYDDLSRTDNLLTRYSLRFGETVEQDGHLLYQIIAEPHAAVAVVWGREELVIRDDDVVLVHRFYDQDAALVKTMQTMDIGMLSGRTFGTRTRMQKAETPDAWTEVEWRDATFDLELPDDLFTLYNLQHGKAPAAGPH